MECIITSPETTTTFKDVRSALLKTKHGVAEIRPGHATYVVELVPSELVLLIGKKKERVKLEGEAICTVVDDVITIIS